MEEEEMLRLMHKIEELISKLAEETDDAELLKMNEELRAMVKESEVLLTVLKNLPLLESMGMTHEERKIGYEDWTSKFNTDLSFLSTCRVVDNPVSPYETAILHPEYSERILALEYYKTPEEAKIGHEKWKQIFETNPPDFVVNVMDCLWGLGDVVGKGKKEVFRRKKCGR